MQGASPWQPLEPITMIKAGKQTASRSSEGWRLRAMLVPTVTRQCLKKLEAKAMWQWHQPQLDERPSFFRLCTTESRSTNPAALNAAVNACLKSCLTLLLYQSLLPFIIHMGKLRHSMLKSAFQGHAHCQEEVRVKSLSSQDQPLTLQCHQVRLRDSNSHAILPLQTAATHPSFFLTFTQDFTERFPVAPGKKSVTDGCPDALLQTLEQWFGTCEVTHPLGS